MHMHAEFGPIRKTGEVDSISILLPTYNGAAHLRDQLDSLLRQTHTNWRLIARDDGSTDGTMAILSEYADRLNAKEPGKMIILPRTPPEEEMDQSRLWREERAVRNYSQLMEWAKKNEVGYAMVCDHDDIWHPEKIEKTIAAMHHAEQMHGRNVPLLVHADAAIADSKGATIHHSIKHKYRVQPSKMTFRNDLVQCVTHGPTIMINRSLLELATPIPPQAVAADMWLGLVASAAGHREYIDAPLLKYRQHDANISGGTHNTRMVSRLKRARTYLDRAAAQAEALQQRLNGECSRDKAHDLARFLEICDYPQPVRGLMLIAEGYERTPKEQDFALFGGSWSGNGHNGNGYSR